MGMRNHELVPGPLVNSIATLRFGGCGKLLVNMTKHKLLAYERGKRYDGYRLTYAGYDYLALNALTRSDVVGGVGNQIGVGKESDVYVCESPDSESQYAIKFHRLGRVCFRKVMEKRDFYTKNDNKTSWIYLSRKAAQREYEFLRFMYQKGLPVPKPIANNRHLVVMELIDGQILNRYTLESFEPEFRDKQISDLYEKLMNLILRFANETRLVHGDFNEFNILIKHIQGTNELEPIIIDLPQMIGVEHELAPDQFKRDVDCIVDFFNKRFHYESDFVPSWDDVHEFAHEEDKFDKFLNDTLKNIVTDEERDTTERSDDEDPDHISKPEMDDANMKLVQQIQQDRIEQHLHDDIDDCMSTFSVMTIDPLDARRRLRSETIKRENSKKRREAAKQKNIKGDANPVRRRRKTNRDVICEELA